MKATTPASDQERREPAAMSKAKHLRDERRCRHRRRASRRAPPAADQAAAGEGADHQRRRRVELCSRPVTPRPVKKAAKRCLRRQRPRRGAAPRRRRAARRCAPCARPRAAAPRCRSTEEELGLPASDVRSLPRGRARRGYVKSAKKVLKVDPADSLTVSLRASLPSSVAPFGTSSRRRAPAEGGALLQADARIRRPRDRRRRRRAAPKRGSCAELAFEDDADAEARGDGLAHAFARLRPRSTAPGLTPARGQRASNTSRVIEPRSRSTRSWPGELGERDALARRAQGCAARHEQHQPVAAERQRVEARIGGELGHHRHIGLVVEQLLQHRRRVADGEREATARHGGGLSSARSGIDVIGAVGGDAQMAALPAPRAPGEQRLGLVLERERRRGDGEQVAGRARSARRRGRAARTGARRRSPRAPSPGPRGSAG